MKKVGIIIQARMGSSRLPNKMLLPFYKKQGILELLLSRIKKNVQSTQIVVATTTSIKDDKIVDLCNGIGCEVFRGSEDDVLERFIQTAKYYDFDKIIRICADNPFLDILELIKMIKLVNKMSADYFCYSLSDGTPSILTHYGFWGEGVTLEALKKIKENTSDSFYHEHVTNYIYHNSSDFRIEKVVVAEEIQRNKVRLTIDTKEDFTLAALLYDEVLSDVSKFTTKDIINYIVDNKEMLLKMQEQIKLNTKK